MACECVYVRTLGPTRRPCSVAHAERVEAKRCCHRNRMVLPIPPHVPHFPSVVPVPRPLGLYRGVPLWVPHWRPGRTPTVPVPARPSARSCTCSSTGVWLHPFTSRLQGIAAKGALVPMHALAVEP
jgi:hypothetical protein